MEKEYINQGKSKQQYLNSSILTGFAIIAIILCFIGMIIVSLLVT